MEHIYMGRQLVKAQPTMMILGLCYDVGHDGCGNGNQDEAHYDGFMAGCVDANNSREVCEQATDAGTGGGGSNDDDDDNDNNNNDNWRGRMSGT